MQEWGRVYSEHRHNLRFCHSEPRQPLPSILICMLSLSNWDVRGCMKIDTLFYENWHKIFYITRFLVVPTKQCESIISRCYISWLLVAHDEKSGVCKVIQGGIPNLHCFVETTRFFLIFKSNMITCKKSEEQTNHLVISISCRRNACWPRSCLLWDRQICYHLHVSTLHLYA